MLSLKVKKTQENKLGIVEGFSVYEYNGAGYVDISTLISVKDSDNPCLAEPYVYRGRDFIPARVIDEEMGIEKYFKAKKPFYVLLDGEAFIVRLKLNIDFSSGEYRKNKSVLEAHRIVSRKFEGDNGVIVTNSILDVPEDVNKLMEKVAEESSKFGKDRASFLRSRFK